MLTLTVIQGPDKGRRFDLPDNEPQMIGRSSESLPLSDQTISRRHAELTPDEGKWYIYDLKSANGSYVNGVRVTDRRQLQPGDQIRTGTTLLLFGEEPKRRLPSPVRVARKGEIEINVEKVAQSNDDSMIMAVPEPSEAAVYQLKVIYELTGLVGSVTDERELLEKAIDVVFNHFQADRGFILLMETPTQAPDPVVVRHRVPPRDQKAGQITISRTIVQYVLRKKVGVLSTNAMNDERFSSGDSVQNYGIRSAICVPIAFKDRIFGVVYLDSQIANYTYTEDQLTLLTAIGVQTGVAMANARNYAERLARERLAAVGETVASLSHSVRNILQAMRGGADVVELGLRKSAMNVVANGWEIVSRNLERIYELTLNMLAFSKQRRPELEMTNLARLVGEVVDLVQKQFDNKNVALIADVSPDLPPVPLDPGGVHQALLNLINNALDAVEPQSGVVTIHATYEDATQTVTIRVTDNGEGITPALKPRIFEPFQSTKGLRGTGLGLVVTKKIVEEHGGRIAVDSKPGQGATFTMTLPCTMPPTGTSADTQGPPAGLTAGLALRKGRPSQ
jgi:signal transduction histidine kinase/pSer/pThr/pTyr-binding forkhead associated (FHA) protein